MRLLIQGTMGLVAIVLLSGCMGSQSEGLSVSATDNQFSPNTATVKEGTEMTVTNNGNNLHSVTIHKVGDSVTTTEKDSDIAKGTSTNYMFEEPGTFHVYCKYHSDGVTGGFGTGMVLTVTVEA